MKIPLKCLRHFLSSFKFSLMLVVVLIVIMIAHVAIIIITVVKSKERPWDKMEMAYERIKMVVPVPSGNTRGEAMKVERDNQTRELRASLMVQWVRICLPMQRTQV